MLLLSIIIRFTDLLLAALLVGAMFCVWLVFDPKSLDAPNYVVLQQQSIRGLNIVMPLIGAATLLVTLTAAALSQSDRTRLIMLVVAACAFLAAGIITRFLNQPINAIMMRWSPASVPDGWTTLRDTWWHWHLVRLACGLAGLSLLILAEIVGGTKA
jgi:uncharacterized membrane protein